MNKEFRDNLFIDGKKIWLGAGCIAVLVAITWIIIENMNGGNYILKNNSERNIEYIESTFINEDWQVSDKVIFTDIKGKTEHITSFGEYELDNLEASIQLKIKFEGYAPVVLEAGYFNEILTGDIEIDFYDYDENNVQIDLKATNSFLAAHINGVDDSYLINVTEGYIE